MSVLERSIQLPITAEIFLARVQERARHDDRHSRNRRRDSRRLAGLAPVPRGGELDRAAEAVSGAVRRLARRTSRITISAGQSLPTPVTSPIQTVARKDSQWKQSALTRI
jgi:hypothetical protein